MLIGLILIETEAGMRLRWFKGQKEEFAFKDLSNEEAERERDF
jgi:hypothetical protein